MPQLRPFRPGDESALAAICLRTADAGSDATGILDDDELWAALFVLPYLQRHPDLAFVVADEAGEPAGYVVGTPDTAAFEDWFAEVWWPPHAARWPRPAHVASAQDRLVAYGHERRGGAQPYGDAYPAHLHIDLLPVLQGQGWGRLLIAAFVAALAERGVVGVHLAADARNAAAAAFYPRVGFAPIPAPAGTAAFARRIP